MLQDLRFALRMMRKNPGFCAIAVLALGLGIGANNTVFTLVNTILLKSLPFKDGQEIVHLGCKHLSRGMDRMAVSYPDFADWRAQARSFQGIAAFTTGTMNVSDEGGAPERFSGAWLTAGTFRLIGLSPILGRDFLPAEDQRNAQPVVLLGYGAWQTRYGGDPGIVGKTIRINALPSTVIGVMAQGMKFPFDAELWMPLIQTPNREERGNRDLLVFGRLRKDVSMAQAQAELTGITGRLAREYPDSNKEIGAEVMSFNERYNSGEIEIVLWIMMGAVGFVLLIACVNVANLLLSRAVCRYQETSVRAAVGAGRWRIIRQLLIESLLLALAGGTMGIAISLAGVRWFHSALRSANIEGMPYWLDFSMDWTVFGYLLAACFATGSLFGVFALVSLLLSAVGIYGVTAYAASQRTQEIGVRMALGASGCDVLFLMLRMGLRQMLAGLALGLVGTLMLGRVLESLLLETKATDLASNLVGISVLCAITILACLVPALRASRLDPLSALRIRR
jgi:putative ABC transport system permease protein